MLRIQPLPRYEDVIRHMNEANGQAPPPQNSLPKKSHLGRYLGIAFGVFVVGTYMWGSSFSMTHNGRGMGGSFTTTYNTPHGKKQTIILKEGAPQVIPEPSQFQNHQTQQTTSQPGIVVIQSPSSGNGNNNATNSTGK